MTCTVLMGAQWGDEGKGKVTDILSEGCDAVVRFQGGNNAGHTIVVGGQVFKLHIVPSGVLRENGLAVIGDGCVVDPWVLDQELSGLESKGISTSNVVISDRAHLIMPYHKLLDGLQEEAREGSGKVGTTGRGVGPCYQDRAGRFGIRAGDLRFPKLLEEKVSSGCIRANNLMSSMGGNAKVDPAAVLKDIQKVREKLLPMVRDAPALLGQLLDEGKQVLLEGAQGAFLDIDRGTYPYVTSSSCSAGNASSGSGIGLMEIDRIVGVVKAYTTRVGEGPFPTELVNEIGGRMREKGREYGTTTNRPRRCGWLDLVMVRSAVRWNSMTELALTKIDVLSGIDPLMVCTEYMVPRDVSELHGTGTILRHFPSHIELLSSCKPVLKRMKGWKELSADDWQAARGIGDLPREMRDYIALIEEQVLSNVSIVSYGPARDETMLLSGDGA